MWSCSELPMKKRRVSLFVSDDTFHQKLKRAGPVTVVWMEFDAPSPMIPLRAASSPSWWTATWPSQGGAEPPVVQIQPGVSSADRKSTRLNSSHVRISYA